MQNQALSSPGWFNPLRHWLTLLPLAFVGLHSSPAMASTNRVGVLNIAYTVQATGTGTLDWDDPVMGWEIESDTLSVSASGTLQYEVLQTAPRLYLGDLLAQNVEESDTGSGSETQGYPGSSSTIHADWTYRHGSAAHGLALTYDSGSGYRANYVFSYTADVTGDLSAVNNVVGVVELASLLYNTNHVDFYLTNAVRPWGGTFSATGASSNTVSVHAVTQAAGTMTLTLEYIPDQLVVPYTATPTNGFAGLTVQFSSGSLDSMNNSIATWHWNFGDGTVTNVTGPAVSHRYVTNGTFAVSLSATNTSGIFVKGAGPATVRVALPTLQFTAWPTNGWMPLSVGFDFPDLDSGHNAIVGWKWDFGDLDTDTTYRNPQHTYLGLKSKTYSPKLTVTNELGLVISAKGPKISAGYPAIVFTADPTNSLIPMQVQFHAPDVDVFGVAIKGWTWYFGDGALGTGQNPSHTYIKRGVFAPMLLATNANKALVAGFGPSISAGYQNVLSFGAASGFDPSSSGWTNTDGIHPQAGLVQSSNRLYGVMSSGGTYGSGTIFAVNTDGSGFTNLHYFTPVPMMWYTNADGASPKSRLVLEGQTLYGSAASGGSSMNGALFRMNIDGSCFTNLHNFNWNDGGGTHPNGLVLCDNALYGTTEDGGSNYNGVVFKVDRDGSNFTVLHQFSANGYDPVLGSTNFDGASPKTSLTVAETNLAGRTLYGSASWGGGGGGTVFKLGTDGSGFTVLHSFTHTDGSSPQGELLLADNTLYGTTFYGGSTGAGSVFKVKTDGSGFTTLYSFSACRYDSSYNLTNSEGAQPSSGLCLAGGLLYGTTTTGGAGGAGAVFAIGTNGIGFTNLYLFGPLVYSEELSASINLDGANPAAGVVATDACLYGTTANGGPAGNGTLFALSLSEGAPRVALQFSSSALLISWPSTQTRWWLEQCTNLTAGAWTRANPPVSDDGTTRQVSLSPPSENMFFRLAK